MCVFMCLCVSFVFFLAQLSMFYVEKRYRNKIIIKEAAGVFKARYTDGLDFLRAHPIVPGIWQCRHEIASFCVVDVVVCWMLNVPATC